jgi:hypothetical protein
MPKATGCAVLGFCLVLLWSQPALAYLDPGTGSMFIQLILGGLAGIAVMGRLAWTHIKSKLTRTRPTSEPDEQH